jgi:hypothetical protein
VPKGAGAQPSTYLEPPLGGTSGGVSNSTRPGVRVRARALLHDVRYDGFALERGEIATDGEVEVSCVVRNSGDRAGAEVVQLYIATRWRRSRAR